MRYQVLATDYDGTLAADGHVDAPTLAALERLLATGRRLVLVTGRELPEVLELFPQLDLCEWVVAENGALLYRPGTREERPLAPPPPEKLLRRLREGGVAPLSAGRVIIATREPHENAVLEAIHDLGLEMQVIFNKGAVMVLPAGVNKATGLTAVLKEMGLSPHNAAGVGDAENDHAFLRLCEFSAAVSNALPAVKETADLVTANHHGAGVAELIDALVATDLHDRDEKPTRDGLPLGTHDGVDVTLPPYGPGLLIVGPSASGKSTVATSILETLAARKYQFCILDPEGDYESFDGPVVLGGPQRAPAADEVLRLLANPEENVVVSLTGLPIPDRPRFFLDLLPRLLEMRARTGRPHWLIFDEAHHLMPAEWQPPGGVLPEQLYSTLYITVHPELLAESLLKRVGTVLAVGQDAGQTLRHFATAVGSRAPRVAGPELEPGEVFLWSPGAGEAPLRLRVNPARAERRRHRRKYAEGALPPERSFYFRGPAGTLNLRAQNLILFLQIADGVDDETWEHHLRNGDIVQWFREGIKDDNLAAEAERVAKLPHVTPVESRALIRTAVERDYTLPASPPLPVPGAQ
jgi:hydroxymethylpyrimidine pyrophosphatase-like HAD family hydrolase